MRGNYALKNKKASKYFVRVYLIDLPQLFNFQKSMNTPKVFWLWKKNIGSFHKYCPTAYSPAISAKFVLEKKVRN